MTSYKYQALIRNPVTSEILCTVGDNTVASLVKRLSEGDYFNFLPEQQRPKYHQLANIRYNSKPTDHLANNPRQVVQIVKFGEEPKWPPARPEVKVDGLSQSLSTLSVQERQTQIPPSAEVFAKAAADQVDFDDVIKKLFQYDPKGRLTATEIAMIVNEKYPGINFTPVIVGRLMIKNKTPYTHGSGCKNYHIRLQVTN